MAASDSKNLPATFAIVITIIFSFLTTVRSYAQVAGATLSGTITDVSGAAIPNVQITITDVGRDVTRSATTDSDGFYTAPNLVPSTYQLTATAQGFATMTQSGITLTVGAKQVLNFKMTVGEVSQKVEVTTEAPTVELASSTLGGLVSAQTVVELPLNGRDWTQLATLQPAVHFIPQLPIGGASNRANRGFGTQLSISGTRPQLNNYRLDGISIVDYAGGAPGSVLGIALGVDAIAEFSVVTANYSAEYGRTSGGVINAITRAGTNTIHGDAYYFLRDEGFDARNYFATGQIPPFHRNQFGGSVGGPIQKDKTFFFVDYEGIRQAKSIPNLDFVPSADAHNGIIHNSNGTTSPVNANILPFLAFWPLPDPALPALSGGNAGSTTIYTNNINNGDFVTFRIDRKISAKDSIFGTYFHDGGVNGQPDALNNESIGNTSTRQMIALEETHIFSPTLVNTVRFGLSRVHTQNQTILSITNPLLNNTSNIYSSFPGHAASQIIVSSGELTTFSGGANGLSTGSTAWNSFQGYDDAFLTKGVHALKFGFAVERMQENTGGSGSTPDGQTKFGSLAAFLNNQPTNFTAAVPGNINTGARRQTLYGGYIQDDWRFRSNITLNLGLRYEVVTVPTDAMGALSLLPTPTSATVHLGSPLYNNPTLRNFEPRLGFAWDPFHDGKTAVRAAFGIFDALPLLYEFNTEVGNAPFSLTETGSGFPQGSFPGGVTSGGKIPAPAKLRYGFMEQSPKRNYIMIWNLNVQRELSASTTMTVGFVGNHGVHMINRTDDINMVLPIGTTSTGALLWPSPVGSGTRINPNVGAIRGDFWSGDSEYDALEVQVLKRLSHSFQVQGSYTWSKGIDTGSASVLGDPFTNSISSLFWFCNSCRRGLSDFNIAHTLSANYMWNVPGPKNWGGIAAHVLGGWQFGGIITAQTGVPFTPLMTSTSGDPLGLNNTDSYAYPNRDKNAPGCQTATNPDNINHYINLSCFSSPCTPAMVVSNNGNCPVNGNAGRNSIIGPGLVTWDVSLFKNNYIRRISETFNIQFRTEIFNALNRPNFTFQLPSASQVVLNVSTGLPSSSAGILDGTSTTEREIQFALKMIW